MFLMGTNAPELEARHLHAHHRSQPFRLRVELRMLEEAPDGFGGPVVGHVQPHQAVMRVPPFGTVKVAVEAEERRLRQPVQDGNQILIIRADGRDIRADDTEMHPPLKQAQPLAGGQIFVEH